MSVRTLIEIVVIAALLFWHFDAERAWNAKSLPKASVGSASAPSPLPSLEMPVWPGDPSEKKPTHEDKSPERLQRACASGNLAACTELGTHYEATHNIPEAMKAFESACFKGGQDADPCTRIGYHVSEPQAMEAEKSCQSGSAPHCLIYAAFRYQHSHDEVARYLQRACELGGIGACIMLGENITVEDRDKVITKCRTDAKFCLALFLDSSPLSNTPEKARYLGYACKSGLVDACMLWGQVATETELEASRKKCMEGAAASCVELSGAAKKREDVKAVRSFLGHACEKKLARACELLRQLGSPTE